MATRVAAPQTPTTSDAGRPVYTRVAAVGLALVAAAPALMLSLGLLAGMEVGEELPFFGTLIVVPLVVAGLVWRFGTWAKALGIVAAAGAAFMMFWAVFGLSYPGSLGDFLPGVLLPLGAILAIGGGIAAIVQKRRGRLADAATPAEKRVVGAALGIVALALVGSLVTGWVQGGSVGGADAALTATMKNFEFAEGTYEVAAGQTTAIRVRNDDAFTHTFTVPELGIDETVLPGKETVVEIDAPAGTYTLFCKPHSNPDAPDPEQGDMAGAIVAR